MALETYATPLRARKQEAQTYVRKSCFLDLSSVFAYTAVVAGSMKVYSIPYMECF